MNSPGKMLQKWFGEDSNFQKMQKGEVAWGNLLASSSRKRRHATAKRKSLSRSTRKTPRTPPTPKAPHPSPWSSLPSTSTRILENYKTPRVRDPRDLLKHFPIDLLRDRDSDVMSVVWNKKLLNQWKDEHPTSFNEYLEYEMYTEFRLVHTLRQHKDLFEIMAPHGDEIVRIRFRAPKAPSPPPVRLLRREDIYKNFPVIVDRREGRPGEATFGIVLRGDFKRAHSVDQVAHMTGNLMRALQASKYWKVLPAVRDDEICRIEMSHA